MYIFSSADFEDYFLAEYIIPIFWSTYTISTSLYETGSQTAVRHGHGSTMAMLDGAVF